MTKKVSQDSGPANPNQRAEKPTLKTIAKLAGLAVPTVSRALNDAPDIGAKTKAKVRQIAEEIGYVPNRAGVRLRTGRTNVVSLVISTDHNMMNHTARLISSLAGGLRGTPFHLNITPYFPDEDPMRPVRYIVETKSADAVILNQTMPKDPRVAYLMEQRFPFATHGRTDWKDQHAFFDFDNRVFGELAMSNLVAKGRKNVLLIAPPLEHYYALEMLTGAEAAAKKFGVKFRVTRRVTSDAPGDVIKDRIGSIIDEDPTVDGFICASTSSAMAAVWSFENRGQVVGRTFDVVAREAIPFLNMFRPGIVAIAEDVGLAGDFLAEAAMAAVNDPDAKPLQKLVGPDAELFGRVMETIG